MYAELGRGGVRLTAAAPLFHRPALDDHLQNVYHPKWSRLMMHEGQAGYPLPAASQVNDLLSALQGVGGQAVSSSGVNGKQGVVSEGQAYAMLSAGMRNDTALLKALTVGWQAQVQGVAGEHACGACCGVGDHQSAAQLCGRSASSLSGLCRRVPGTDMPAWSLPFDSEGSLGSATDGDEDAVTALIYLAELLDDDEVRRYAVASITAFVLEDLGLGDPSANSRPVPVAGDVPAGLRTIWLWRGGSCWGGYDKSATGYGASSRNMCIAPAYFSPGQWRLFAKYISRHSHLVPAAAGHSAMQIADVLLSSVTWGYNLLNRISCSNGLVSNWWTLGEAWPWEGKLLCANSATRAGAYGADAVRIPWRVVLDYLWFPEETIASPLFDERGVQIGTWGAKEYANRWAGAWRSAIQQVVDYKGDPLLGSFPPFAPGVQRLRPDQILPLLSKLPSCATCPLGMTAVRPLPAMLAKLPMCALSRSHRVCAPWQSPWNGWGSYPIVAAFLVPLDGVRREEMQEWLDMLAELTFTGTSHDTYFDLGTQVIVSAIIGGGAWNPLRPVRPPSPPAPPPPSHSPHPPPPLGSPRSWTSKEPGEDQPHPPPPAPVAQPALLAATLRVKHRRVKKVATSASSTLVVGLGLASAFVLTLLYALRGRIMRALDRAWRCGSWLQFPTTEKLTEMPLNGVTGEHESLAEPDDATSTGLAEDDAPRPRGVLGTAARSSDLD